MSYLKQREIEELTKVAVRHGMGRSQVRERMFDFIDPEFVAQLDVISVPADQVRSDLVAMNRTVAIESDGKHAVPLLQWLEAGVHRLEHQNAIHLRVFQRHYKKVKRESEHRIAELSDGDFEPPSTIVEERYIVRDDTLSYEWMTDGVEVGRAVARIMVTRYKNGSPLRDESGGTAIEFGTGWLIGSQHLITNFHVLNAMPEGQIANSADIERQAKRSLIQFDYDSEQDSGYEIDVASLVVPRASSRRPKLDYAILKLDEPLIDRIPLRLAPNFIYQVAGGVKPLVNIIQHPHGKEKRVGIRNNPVNSIQITEFGYFTDTDSGSSGSPVLNDLWQVVGLHVGSDKLFKKVEFQDTLVKHENRGIHIGVIIQDLKTNYPDVWDAINATIDG